MKRLVIIIAMICALSVSALAAYPSEVIHEEHDEFRYVRKTYTMSPDDDPGELEEAPFELLGYTYSMFSISKDENAYEDSRDHTEKISVETDSKDLEEVLSSLPSSVEYNKDGYIGTLMLDHTTIKSEVSGYSSKAYTVKDTKTIPNLDRNDPGYIEKTAVKNGVTLALTSVDWSVDAVDGDLNPISYTATAYYSGGYTGRVADGYVTTAEYSGRIESKGVSSVTYTVTYIGQEIEPIPPPETELNQTGLHSQYFITCLISLLTALLVVSGVLLLPRFIKRNVQICSRDEESGALTLHAKRRISVKNPVVDLSRIKMPDTEFMVGIDSATAEKLFWKVITVRNGEKTSTHLVENVDSGTYWFSVSPFENYELNYERTNEI